MFEFLDHDNAAAFADDEAIAILIERTRRALRFVVARAQRFHRGETGETDGNDGRFRAAGEEDFGIAEFDDPPGFADGVVRSRAGGDNAHVRPAQAPLHRDEAAGHVPDEHRNGERGDAIGTFVEERAVLVFERFQAADAAADHDAETIAIDLLEIEIRIGHGAFRRGHREMGKAIGALVFLRIIEDRFRIKVANLAADFAVVTGGLEISDRVDAAPAFEKIIPEGFQLVAQGRRDAHAGDDYSAFFHWWESREAVLSINHPARVVTSASTRAHPDALDGLEKLAFGFDRGCDDDLGLLKLRQRTGADVAHAGRDCADEVLTAVVDLGRSE